MLPVAAIERLYDPRVRTTPVEQTISRENSHKLPLLLEAFHQNAEGILWR